jgi:F0F1-type ATP synthase membrane subunit b/b'
MIKHRTCCLLVATMCSFLLPPLGAAAEEDQIESQLTEAQEHFAELEAELRDALVSAMCGNEKRPSVLET